MTGIWLILLRCLIYFAYHELVMNLFQGIVNTSEGKVVRAFHRFTLVDQTGVVEPRELLFLSMSLDQLLGHVPGGGRDLTKGRTRDAGAVKISCARQVSLQSMTWITCFGC